MDPKKKDKTHISLLEFIRTGSFGPIQIGDHQNKVLKILGEPDDTAFPSGKRKEVRFWLYDNFEIYFNDNNKVYSIYTDHLDWPVNSKSIELDRWVLTHGANLQKIEDALSSEQINFKYAHEFSDANNNSTIELNTDSLVKLFFVIKPEEKNGFTGLYGICKSIRDDYQQSKQVSISIPNEIYERIRSQADKTKKRIGHICCDIIIREFE